MEGVRTSQSWDLHNPAGNAGFRTSASETCLFYVKCHAPMACANVGGLGERRSRGLVDALVVLGGSPPCRAQKSTRRVRLLFEDRIAHPRQGRAAGAADWRPGRATRRAAGAQPRPPPAGASATMSGVRLRKSGRSDGTSLEAPQQRSSASRPGEPPSTPAGSQHHGSTLGTSYVRPEVGTRQQGCVEPLTVGLSTADFPGLQSRGPKNGGAMTSSKRIRPPDRARQS